MVRRTIYGIGLAACVQELTGVGTATTPCVRWELERPRTRAFDYSSKPGGVFESGQEVNQRLHSQPRPPGNGAGEELTGRSALIDSMG
jgi:hypothetical protein